MNGMNLINFAVSVPEIAEPFSTLAVTVNRRLTLDEISLVSGCIGYALASTLAGEGLSDPETVQFGVSSTRITYSYDATKSRRDDPDYEGALRLAGEMLMTGSPVRKTNRAGANTAGTRLVEGIGACAVTFEVDMDDPEPTPPAFALTADAQALAELNAARDALNAAMSNYQRAAANYAGVSL